MINAKTLINLAREERSTYEQRGKERVGYIQQIENLQTQLDSLDSRYATPYLNELLRLRDEIKLVKNYTFWAKLFGIPATIFTIPGVNVLVTTLGKYVGLDVPLLLDYIPSLSITGYSCIFFGFGTVVTLYTKSRVSRELKSLYGEDVLEKSNIKTIENEAKNYQKGQ